jgi:hypothetical protein
MILRPAIAAHPHAFGRRGRARPAPLSVKLPSTLGADLRLFATAFSAGFVFVAVFIG